MFTMDPVTQTKTERINLRLKSSAKSLLERAAGFEGKTVSHFILNSALERAEKTVQKHEVMILNAKDSKTFFSALSKPVRFSRKLIDVLEEHSKRVVSK
jgi:uncharacterized protein (DUF1778 family)